MSPIWAGFQRRRGHYRKAGRRVWRSRQRGAGRCGYLKSFVSRAPLRPRARGLPEADPQPARGEKPAAAAGRGAAATRYRLMRGHRGGQEANAHMQPRRNEKHRPRRRGGALQLPEPVCSAGAVEAKKKTVGACTWALPLAWGWAARTKVLSGAPAKAGFSFGDGAALAL